MRLGLVLPADPPGWVWASASELTGVPGVQIAASFSTSQVALARPSLWERLLDRLDATTVSRGADAFRPAPGHERDGLGIQIQVDSPEHLGAEARHLGLDLLVSYTPEVATEGVASSTKLGIWRHQLGTPGDWLPGAAEVAGGAELTRAALDWALPDGTRATAFEALQRTYAHSPRQNAEFLARLAVPFAAREAARYLRLGRAAYESWVARRDTESQPRPRGAAGGRAAARWLGSAARRALAELRSRDQWCLLLARQPIDMPLRFPWERATAIEPPGDRFWADPHVVRVGRRHYVFFEQYVYAEGKGTIAVLAWEDGRVVEAPQVVLSEDHHLSYPLVFERNGKYYMLPEAEEAKRIVLYEAEEFPRGWTAKHTLLEGLRASDATLLERDGRWWLFAAVAETRGAPKDVELHVFHADELTGPYEPHPCNPVVADVRHARPAGPLFESGGSLYRPSQDCSERYGGALNLMELVSLTPEHYAERPAGRLEPGPKTGWRGVHSLTGDSEITVIDALRSVPRRP